MIGQERSPKEARHDVGSHGGAVLDVSRALKEDEASVSTARRHLRNLPTLGDPEDG